MLLFMFFFVFHASWIQLIKLHTCLHFLLHKGSVWGDVHWHFGPGWTPTAYSVGKCQWVQYTLLHYFPTFLRFLYIYKINLSMCDYINKYEFPSNRAEKGRHTCSRDIGRCFQDPGRQRENQQILREGVEYHAKCWRGCGQRMCPAGSSHFLHPYS